MRRLAGVVTIAALLLSGCSDDDGTEEAEATAAESPAPAEGHDDGPTVGPLVSGTASIVDGTFAWTDYVYDDRGADTEPGDRTDLDAAGGDAVHGNGWRNEADLVQTQLRLEDGRVHARFVLETLTDPFVPMVALAFDTDDDPSTGTAGLGPWSPDGDVGALGAEQVAVLAAEGATLSGPDGATQDLEVTVDPEANVIEATLPLEPDGATWTAYVAAATSGPGDAVTVHDLGLLGGEPEYRWQDDIQADLLAGDGSIRDATAAVPFGELADGGTELADATTEGFHTYLYESELDLGEGVEPVEDGLEYRGPYQPYLVYVPEGGVAEGAPMTVFLHGLTQNHLGSVLSPDGSYLGTGRPLSEEIHHLGQYARDGLDFTPHNLTVWPLARGEGLGYRGIAEQDVLDVLADASERFSPDPDRIILSGGSMGGIGAFRLGALHPDLFSVNAPLIGFATEDTEALLANLWNVPVRQINGAQDPLIEASLAEATTDAMDDLELDYRAWMLDQRGHEAGGFAYDCVLASLPEFERVARPTEVRYTVDPAQFVSDPASGLELTYDGAYWVSGMALADEGDLGSVVARVDAGQGEPAVEHIDRRGESGTGGDLCGPNPDVQTDDTWRERAVERDDPEVDLPAEGTLVVELTNLSAVTLDLTDLLVGGAVEVTADVPAEVTLLGLSPGTEVTVGDEAVAADDAGSATLPVPAGRTSAAF